MSTVSNCEPAPPDTSYSSYTPDMEGTSHGPRGLPVMSASSVIGPMYERVVKKEVTALASPSYLWPELGSTPPSPAPSCRRGTTGSKPSRAGRISGKTYRSASALTRSTCCAAASLLQRRARPPPATSPWARVFPGMLSSQQSSQQ